METTHHEPVRLYLVLGCLSPQRDHVLLQLVEYLQHEGDSVTLCHENAHPVTMGEDLERCMGKGLKLDNWSLSPAGASFQKAPPVPCNTDVLLWSGPGTTRLADAIEAVATWLPESGCTLERVITWVDAARYHRQRQAQHWYHCCFHFSDLVLMDEFRELPASWLKEFRDYFHQECLPCIIENTRKGRVQHPNLVLDNQILRISQVFEPDESGLEGIEVVVEEDDEEEEPGDAEDWESIPKERYFERSLDGKHSNPVPDLPEN
jgi:hypothetical protein